MEGSKIHLSPTELELACNAQIILTKNTVIQKTIALFEVVQDAVTKEKKSYPASNIFSVSPKISKGENYLGLPYVVLDYPRIAAHGNLCFIRTMFWWGHFFSSTLQFSGSYKEQCMGKIIASRELLSSAHYFIGVHADPWQHHFQETNYRKIDLLSPKEFEVVLHEQPHIKIAAKWPLNEWNLAATVLVKSWNVLAGLIT